MKKNVSQSTIPAQPASPSLSELCRHCRRQSQCAIGHLTARRTPPTGIAALPQIEIKTYRAGHFVVRQGDPLARLPLVCRGLITITALSESGDEVALETCGVGEFVGLVDWLRKEETYSISGCALTDTTVVLIKPDDLLGKLETIPSLLTTVLGQIGLQLQSIEHRLGWQTVQDTSGRVIHCLLDLVRQLGMNDRDQVILPTWISRTLIAELSGIRRETVSRVLTRLQRKRLIVQSNHHTTVPSLRRLQEALRPARKSS